MAGRRFFHGLSPARFSVLVTIALVVLVSAAAVTALVLWPAEDEYGFGGSWQSIGGDSGSQGETLRIELTDGTWLVGGTSLAALGGAPSKRAHLDDRTLVVDDVAADVRFTVDQAQDRLTMVWRSASGERTVLFVRV